jgi:hypothetical protein
MQIRRLLGRPRPYREIVVRPRPTATTHHFAVAALGTVSVLTATLIGVSQLGVIAGPSAHDGGRILAVPQTPGTTFPFFGFGGTPPPAVTTPDSTTPGTTTPDTVAGDVTGQSHPGAAVTAAAKHAPPAAGAQHQGVTAVSAVVHAPPAGGLAHTTATVVSVASAFPVATVVSVASAFPVATVVVPAPLPAPRAVIVPRRERQRAEARSEHAANRGQATKPPKHRRSPRDAKPAKATRNT